MLTLFLLLPILLSYNTTSRYNSWEDSTQTQAKGNNNKLTISSPSQNFASLELDWKKIYSDQDYVYWPFEMVLDKSKNIYITGSKIDLSNDSSMILYKFDNIGESLWNRTWNYSGHETHGSSIALDSSDNILVGTWVPNFNSYVKKYDSLGNEIGNFTTDGLSSMVLDSSENIYIIDITDIHTIPSEPIFVNISLAKYNSLGQQQWNRSWGTFEYESGYTYITSAAIDTSDNIYIIANTKGLLELEMKMNITMLKYDSSGNLLLNSTWQSYDSYMAMDVDTSQNIYCTTTLMEEFMEESNADAGLIKFNNLGQLQWNRTWDSGESDQALTITIDPSGNIYLAGTTNYTGSYDVLLLKYDSAGVFQWNYIWDGGKTEASIDIVVDSSGTIYVLGMYSSVLWPNNILLMKFIISPGPGDDGEFILPMTITILSAGAIGATVIVLWLRKRRKISS